MAAPSGQIHPQKALPNTGAEANTTSAGQTLPKRVLEARLPDTASTGESDGSSPVHAPDTPNPMKKENAIACTPLLTCNTLGVLSLPSLMEDRYAIAPIDTATGAMSAQAGSI